MKRWAVLIVVMVAALGAIVVSERRKAAAPVSPGAVLTVAADVQRHVSRVPAAVTRISDAEEIRIGDAMAARRLMVHSANSADPDAAVVEAYVQKVGAHVAARAERKLPYRFHYVPERYFVNAYALPGGHVFIGQGLIELMESEDQLAAVLGHEVEHIDRRHCVERVQFEAQMRKLPLGAIGALAEIPVEVFQAGYTKNQELEADREGTKLAVRAGYSYQGAVHLFEAFAAKQAIYERQPPQTDRKSLRREIGKLAKQTITGYFRSHPPAPERIRQIRELAEREGWTTKSERPLPQPIVARVKAKPAEPATAPEPTPGGGNEAPPKSSARVRVGESVMQNQTVSQPPPVYPQMARMARVQGAVVLHVVIDATGAVSNVRAVSGHPMLQQAAMDAVRQWRYRPFLVNGITVEVETVVTVNFKLESS